MASVVDRHIGGWLVFSVSTAVAGSFVWETGRWCCRGLFGRHAAAMRTLTASFRVAFISYGFIPLINVTGVAIFVTSIRSSVAYSVADRFSSFPPPLPTFRESIRSYRLKDAPVDNPHCRKVSPEIRYDIEELEFKGGANNRACKSNINLDESFTFRINPYTREGLVNTPLRPRNTTLTASIDRFRFDFAASRWIFLRESMAIAIYVNFASILVPRLLAR